MKNEIEITNNEEKNNLESAELNDLKLYFKYLVLASFLSIITLFVIPFSIKFCRGAGEIIAFYAPFIIIGILFFNLVAWILIILKFVIIKREIKKFK